MSDGFGCAAAQQLHSFRIKLLVTGNGSVEETLEFEPFERSAEASVTPPLIQTPSARGKQGQHGLRPTASTGTGSHEATVQQSANGAEALTAEDTEAARPPKESAVDPNLRHVDAVEVLDARGRFLHWAPLTAEGLCGHTCSNNKLCNNNVGDCVAHSRREKDLMECEDSRSTIVERGVCGVSLGEGGACQKPQGRCGMHTENWHQQRELAAMREEDDSSCVAHRGRCAVVPRGGGDGCRHPKTRCPHHAEEKERCQSMVERDPLVRCRKRHAEGSRYCEKHADYPDFSVVVQRWIAKHQRTGLPVDEGEFMAHVCAVYPDASYQLPKIYNFQKYVASFANPGTAAERARSRSPKRS